jgi:glycosyltransferase involved in cell wall biosynthesis
MHVLALEPYYGGSHQAFLDGWRAHSRHTWTVMTLPAYKWKWRMRHAAMTFADQRRTAPPDRPRCDVAFCSDMLSLAEFRGLIPPAVGRLPTIAYFHENQLTYPVRHEDERDYHFVLTNLTTALAADAVWFNSAFHRDEWLDALPAFLRKMPDHQPLDAIERIRGKSHVQPPGIAAPPARGPRAPGPLRILWAARWEHDKNPDDFFRAIDRLAERSVDFRLSVIGEQFRDVPDVFATARERFVDRIDHWGYQRARADYEAALREADVIVSTANHEFFGISVVEAIAAGAYPILPRRLAYPEILDDGSSEVNAFFYDGTPTGLANALTHAADRVTSGALWPGDTDAAIRRVRRFYWERRGPELDDAIEQVGARDG